jgi:S-methylmethionine-dependent homocysteine/selenocysteine methylase
MDDSINHLHKDELIELYKDYISNGANVITSNTFSTNPISVESENKLEQCKKEIELAVEICKEVRASINNNDIIIAGSNSTAEECYTGIRKYTYDELVYNHTNNIDILAASGCDFVLNETHGHFEEIKIIVNHCEQRKIPYAISLYITKELKLLSGEDIGEVIRYIYPFNPIFIGFNCIALNTFRNAYNKVPEIKEIKRLGLYLNCGDLGINDIPVLLNELKMDNLFLVGACCMSNPSYIKPIADLYK